MRILYHHRTRSTDAQRVHILEMIHAFETLGHEVAVAGLVHPETAQEDAQRDAGVPLWKRIVLRIPWAGEAIQFGYNFAGLALLLAKGLRPRPDFIYERYALYNFAGVAAARLLRVPIVLEVNGSAALEQKRDGVIRGYAVALWAEKTICNAADHVIVISTPMRRILEGFGVRPEKLVVMPNGVNLEHFQPKPSETEALRKKFGLEGRTVIGFVGWFRDWHKLDVMLEAFHRAHLENPALALMLVGDGPMMPELRAYTAKHGLERSVIFTGPIPHRDVPPYLDLIDVAIQPAANEFCCPMKILEYMSLGKPIVGPRQENIEELVEDGVTGCLFEPGSLEGMTGALRRMAADPGALRRMGRRCVETLHERDLFWTGNARKTLALLRNDNVLVRRDASSAHNAAKM
jgi:glycosyltransferase involved in cell wall biosynthesis